MQKLSVSQLSDLSGKTRETCAKRLKNAALVAAPGPRNAQLYESDKALAAIYGAVEGGDQGALMRAKVADLEAATTIKNLRIAVERGHLIPGEIVEKVWCGFTTAARAKLLSLPYRLASTCHSKPDFAVIESAARALIYESLEELHAYDPADYLKEALPDWPDELAE